MLDKATAKLLTIISGICADGSSKIIEITDLLRELTPRQCADAKNLAQLMQHLADNEMITVKYSDESVYCVAVLPKGRVTNDEAGVKKGIRKPTISNKHMAILMAGCFLSALVGAVIGVLLGNLI